MEKVKSSTGMTVKHIIHKRGNFTKILTLAALFLGAINTEAVRFTKLFDFSVTNGVAPNGELLLSGNILYGTTEVGGTGINANEATDGTGTIFRINTDGTGFTTLHNFSSNTNAGGYGSNADGADPFAGLVLFNNVLYGTASEGGDNGLGTVFKINTDGTSFVTLHSFSPGTGTAPIGEGINDDGYFPIAGLVFSGNTLYGTAADGGSGGAGTVFRVNANGTGFAVLHNFSAIELGTGLNSDGADPRAGLVLSGNTLYGTALAGGSGSGGIDGNTGCGVIFKINIDGTNFTVLHSFSSASDPVYVNSDGANPCGRLVLSGNTLYGTTIVGGSYGEGTIFKINTDGTGFTNLFNFNGINGSGPLGDLVLSGNVLYGATTAGAGTVFAINTDGTGFTNLFSLPFSPTGDYSNGAGPQAGFVLSGNTLYGTSGGGIIGVGTVVALTLFSAPIPLNIQLIGTNVVLSWSDPTFYLQAAPLVSGVYTNVPGATSPYTNTITGSEIFFRLRAD